MTDSTTTTATRLPSDHPFMALFAEFDLELSRASPNLEQYLNKLKLDIQKDPSLVWKLTPEEIGKVVRGASIISRIEIASSTGAKKKKSDLGALEDALGGDTVAEGELDFLNGMLGLEGASASANASAISGPKIGAANSVDTSGAPKLTMAQRLAAKRASSGTT